MFYKVDPDFFKYNLNALVHNWFKQNLTAEEFENFIQAEQANFQIWQSYLDQGLISIEPIYNSFFIKEFNDFIEVKTGHVIKLTPGTVVSSLRLDPTYAYWLSKLPAELKSEVDFIFDS
jgi:hypothetical protein